jgi:hypothetical protein
MTRGNRSRFTDNTTARVGNVLANDSANTKDKDKVKPALTSSPKYSPKKNSKNKNQIVRSGGSIRGFALPFLLGKKGSQKKKVAFEDEIEEKQERAMECIKKLALG